MLNNQAVVESEGALKITPIGTRFAISGSMPEGLTAKASLLLEPTVPQEGEYTVNILYETGGIEWSSRYEAFYDSKTESIKRFTCWVDLANSSGAALEQATMKLIAGSNYGERAHAKGGPRMAMAMSARGDIGGGGLESASFQADAMQSESVGEQKLYTLADPITLEDGESKQSCSDHGRCGPGQAGVRC